MCDNEIHHYMELMYMNKKILKVINVEECTFNGSKLSLSYLKDSTAFSRVLAFIPMDSEPKNPSIVPLLKKLSSLSSFIWTP